MAAQTGNNEASFDDSTQAELDYGATVAGYSGFYDEIAGDAPSIVFDPVTGSALAPDDTVSITVSDLVGVQSAIVWIEWADGATEIAYAHEVGGVSWDLVGSSSSTSGTTIEIELSREQLLRDNFTVHVDATDFRPVTVRSASVYTVAPDVGAPVLANVTPADGASIDIADHVAFDIVGENDLASAVVVARYGDRDDLVFDGDFAARFATSTLDDSDPAAWSFDIARVGGWEDEAFSLWISARDVEGRELLSTSLDYDVTGLPPPDPGDVADPEVSNVSPVAGSPLGPYDAFGFDVTDDVGFAAVIVLVKQGLIWEAVYDGEQLLHPYSSRSTVETIAGGLRFSLKRTGGWSTGPVVRVIPIDTSGNVGDV